MKDKKELSTKSECPCESGKKYGKCCKKKKIKYTKNGEYISKKIPLNEEVLEAINIQKEKFLEYYGREPQKGEFIFQFAPIYNDKILLDDIYMLRQIGVEENKIYAYYKSDGLMPNSLNIDLIAEKDIQEYSDLCREFDEQMEECGNDNIGIVNYVLTTNSYIGEQLDYSINALTSSLNDFIRRHSKTNCIREYVMNTEIDYCMFSAIKTIKVLHSIEELIKINIPECIYALGWGIFENYIYICAINANELLFKERLLPKLDRENYNFDVLPNGKINYKKVVNKRTGISINVEPKLQELKKFFPYKEDNELYDLFYRTACQYVHVDIMSAKSYFAVSDPYDEVNPSLIAGLIVLTITSFLITEISKNRYVQERFRKDIEYLCGNLNCKFEKCLELAQIDTEHKNDIFELLINRLVKSAENNLQKN